MANKFRVSVFLFIGTVLSLNSTLVLASVDSITVKVAILDQLMSQSLSSITYQNDYLKGIELASKEAESHGIHVIYKYFSYDKSPLGIFSAIPEVNKWGPDFIIGPRSSNSMLLLNGKFTKTLVVSPLATSTKLETLPVNFYSFSLSDKYIAKALSLFTIYKFKNFKGVLSIPSEDCISCRNISKLYLSDLKKINSKINTVENCFISNDIEHLDVNSILIGYEKNYIFFTPNMSYVSAVLISRVTNFINTGNLIFVGADEWGSHDIAYIGKISTKHPFHAYHMEDWSIDINSYESTNFIRLFESLFKVKIKDNITYASYHAMHSVISIINKKYFLDSKSKRDYILISFLNATRNKVNNFKQQYYVIYQYDNDKDKPIALINTTNWNIKDI